MKNQLSKVLLFIAVLAFSLASVSESYAAFDFNNGTLQGWTKEFPFNRTLFVGYTGSKPGRSMLVIDSVGDVGGFLERAQGPFSGDWSGHFGLYRDGFIYSNPGLRFGKRIRLRRSDRTTFDSDFPLGPIGAWHSRFVSFNAGANRESGVDNVSSAVAPEPISSILFIVGGATLGFRRFRKKFKK